MDNICEFQQRIESDNCGWRKEDRNFVSHFTFRKPNEIEEIKFPSSHGFWPSCLNKKQSKEQSIKSPAHEKNGEGEQCYRDRNLQQHKLDLKNSR